MSFSKHLGDSVSIADPNDDGRLTIRIPNPKVYMARQSLWIGRRGKPRCDPCRTNNLKCDRVLPVCNHCSWANNRECIYTPLPTPRGTIPRCDRCCVQNLKCDRNLPICSKCREHAVGTTCNYSPKKKQGSNMEHVESAFASVKSSGPWNKPKLAPEYPVDAEPEADLRAHTFYGHNVTPSVGQSASPSISEAESADLDVIPSRLSVGPSRSMISASDCRSWGGTVTPPSVPRLIPSGSIVVDSIVIKPWSHPSFISLPQDVCQELCRIDPVEMPSRHDFDSALSTFQRSVMNELRETSCLSIDLYTTVARSLANGDASSLSKCVQTWTAVHRFCSGSVKQNLILVPRESIFYMDSSEAEAHRLRFVAAISNESYADQIEQQIHHYDRLPVQNQIYDLLTFVHRTHAPASEMLLAVAALGFVFVTWPMAEMYVRLCRLCNLRNKKG